MEAEEIEVRLETKRSRMRVERRTLVAGGVVESGGVPRSTAEYVSALRMALDPTEVGPALAALFMEGVRGGNVKLIGVLLPYVLGRPEEGVVGGGGQLEQVLAAMRSGLGGPVAVVGGVRVLEEVGDVSGSVAVGETGEGAG